ncbi:YlbE-like family protein [Bacillus thermotolerans]|uniref:YlbE-like family protein n=1 Tax=Bacillus thermotolerans TaxID=1221996 RepID=UPI000616FA12|nr:YlbE-like family protein [Bacillus thermotolerans]
MRREILHYIRQNKEWHQYLRQQPSWYRRLSREPKELAAFELASQKFYKKTIPDRIQRFHDGMQMASALFYMMNTQPAPNTSGSDTSETTGNSQ